MATTVLDLPTREVGLVPFRVAPFSEAVKSVLHTADRMGLDTGGAPVHFANAYTIALADRDPRYAELFARPGAAVFTDGVPVAWIGRRVHEDVRHDWDRVYGPDVMEAVLDLSTENGPSHYLLGGSPQTLAQLQSVITHRWPRAAVVGAESPPFRLQTPDEIAAQDARIRASGANIVWVGLGTPKQDWEVARLAAAVPVVAMAVGAAFDFVAGVKPQAPQWMQRSGTEWAFRLATEPRRLAKRYLWGNPRFLIAAARNPGLMKHRRPSAAGANNTNG